MYYNLRRKKIQAAGRIIAGGLICDVLLQYDIVELRSMKSRKHVVYRMLDANANRAVEGLRVAEDFIRFGLNNRALSRDAKTLRHAFVREFCRLPVSLPERLLSRDARRDIGKKSGMADIKSSHDVFVSNLKRAQESLRVIEEISKTLHPKSSAAFERMRFHAYELEKESVACFYRMFREKQKIKGVYFVADMESVPAEKFQSVARQALKAGVNAVQLRWKQGSEREAVSAGKWLRRATKKHGVPFLVNNRVDAAARLDADGVHLGQDDMPLFTARKILGPDKIIGVSTHNPEEAIKAQYEGADYVAAGPVFPTDTKKDAHPVMGVARLRRIKQSVSVPVIAIGGINESNAEDVVKNGKADAVAVISAVTQSKSIRLTVQKLARVFLILIFMLGCRSLVGASDFQSDLQKARVFSSQGRLTEAASLYQILLQPALSSEDFQTISLEYAFVLDRMGRVAEELEILKKGFNAAKNSPQASSLCYTLGALYFRLGKFDDARDDFTACVAAFPAHPNVFSMKMMLAQIEESGGNLDEAEAVFKEALKTSAQDNERMAAREALFDFYIRTKNYQGAKAALEEEVKKVPGDISLLMRLADVYEKLEDFEHALSLYDGLDKTAPDIAFQKKLILLKKLNRLGEEETKLKNKLLQQKTVSVFLRLEQIYEAEGKFEEALALLEKAGGDFPGSEPLLTKLAQMYQQDKQSGRALAVYSGLLSKYPGNVWYYRNIGEVYASEGKKKEAVDAWKKSFAYRREDANSVLNLAMFLHEKSFYEEAAGVYNEGRKAAADEFLFAQQMAQIDRILLKMEAAADEAAKWLAKDQNAMDAVLSFVNDLDMTPEDVNGMIKKLLSYGRKFPQNVSLPKAAAVLALKINDTRKARAITLSFMHESQETCLFLFSLLQNPMKIAPDSASTQASMLEILSQCEDVPSYGNMALNFAQSLLDGKKFEDAERFLEHASEKGVKENERAALKIMLAESYEETGQVQEAQKIYDALLSQGKTPFSPSVYASYGNLLMKQNQYEKALIYFEKAGASGMMSPDALLFYKGECAYFQEKFEDSRGSFENLISLYPQSAYANDAMTRLNIMKNGEPENVKLLLEIGKAQKAQKYDDAETALLFFISQRQSSALLREAHWLLGMNYEFKKNYAKAIEVYRNMLASFEDGAWADDVQERIKNLMGMVKG